MRVVSMPCFELFERQSDGYKARVLGSVPRIIIEAGVRQGWEPYLGRGGRFIGMSAFGMSAPAAQVYEHFGITAEAVIASVKEVA